MFCMVAALQYQSCLETVTLWGQDPNFGLPKVQGLAVWRGAQARCDFAEALRFPAVLQCGAQQILQILQILLMLLPSH